MGDTPCGGCGESVGSAHQCPGCKVSMHPFCGTPVGPEGFVQQIQCPRCSDAHAALGCTSPPREQSARCTRLPQPSITLMITPIAAAFARVQLQPTRKPKTTAGPAHVAPSSPSTSGLNTVAPVICSSGCTSRPSTIAPAQVVTTLAQRRKVLHWMEKTEQVQGDTNLSSKAVDQFPSVFKSKTRKANLAQAADWWMKRSRFLEAPPGSTVVSTRRPHGRARVNRKSIAGRERRTSPWVLWVYPVLLDKFDRLRKAGLKFDAPLLRQVALRQFQVPGATFDTSSVDSEDVLLSTKINSRWIQVFMEKHQVVLRSHTGKRQMSPEKQAEIEREVASHLGQLKRDFMSGKLDENAVENIDETHFIIDFDNGKTLGFIGEKQVKYTSVVSGEEGMTMVVRISGGASGYMHPPMMIFTNTKRNYPIRGDVCYRTGPKGWMDQRLFREYLKEGRAMSTNPRGLQKTIFLDNCSGHLEESQCQEELKDVWSRMWNHKKIELVEQDEWQNKSRKDGSYSGKLKNPGKRFFLELAAAAVREVNQKRDKNGINYARKAMMRCGLSLGIDGTWSATQLFPHLQEIIRKYPQEFAGKSEQGGEVSEDDTEAGRPTEEVGTNIVDEAIV